MSVGTNPCRCDQRRLTSALPGPEGTSNELSLNQPMPPSHPVGQQPHGLISFAHITAAIEVERIAVPVVNHSIRPRQRLSMCDSEIDAMRVVHSPMNEIQRNFAQRLHGCFDIARPAD